jgi:serine/threonine protein kinase
MSKATEQPTPEQFISAVGRSGLLEDAKAAKLASAAPQGARRRSDVLAGWFVSSGILTHYQASKLLQGAERGLVLGPYQLLAPIGRGGMGSVYLARDTRNRRLVALKVLPPHRYKEEERHLTRFRREMDICQKVVHPHLTRTFEAGVLQGVYYIAMEYVPGMTLSRKVQIDGPLPCPRAARIFSQVAAAMEQAHSQGLIHRDLKPSNIMITPNGHAKVLDLGLALIEGEELPADKTIVGGQGYVVGTMDYIAPEQVENPTDVDARADLYSLGCAIYASLAGQPPFPGGTPHQKIKKHLTEWPTPLTELNPTIPIAFAKIVERLMAKRPENRPATCAELQLLLRPWLGDEPDLPMDTAVDNSSPRDVFDLEVDQIATGSFWESMPGTVFLNPNGPTAKAKEPKRVPRESPETPKGSLGVGLAYLGCSALAFLALGAIATAFFLIMYQRT